MEFNYIVNPETGRKVSLNGKNGQRVLRNYLQAGGAIRGSSRIPSDQYCQKGGDGCTQYRKTKKPKCEDQSDCEWIKNKGCKSKKASPKPKAKKASPKPKAKKASPKPKAKKASPRAEKVKTTTTKKHGKSKRLSASAYYQTHGDDRTLGDKCNIRQSRPAEYKCMTKTKSGVARWGKCPPKTQTCQDDEYM